MVRIAPVRLAFNPKNLWFDAGDLELRVGDAVVTSTARGYEFGHVSQAPFEMDFEEVKRLRSPLKPVIRLADEEDVAQADEMASLSTQALPIFKQMARELAPDMNPIAVEYLFEGGKAVFYFDSEERVDFRDLVRKLAAEFHVRVDMKQVGVRDGARMIGGLGHCGQELCCARLGGDFNPVSIRMAKEQDLSLNPQKISGLCGRLMCCLRYEFEAYKDFHGRAPKKNARIDTPDGEGKVVELNVPREIISVKVGDEKPVKVPLADMDEPVEGNRPNSIGEEAWERATTPPTFVADSLGLFTTQQLSGEDKLAEPGKVRHVHGDEPKKPSRRRRRRGSGRGSSGEAVENVTQEAASPRKQRRRRSTTVASDGSTKTTEQPKKDGAQEAEKKPSRRRRSRGRGSGKQQTSQQAAQQGRNQGQPEQAPVREVKVGRNSSGLRAGRDEATAEGRGQRQGQASAEGQASKPRRRRRSHRASSSSSGEPKAE